MVLCDLLCLELSVWWSIAIFFKFSKLFLCLLNRSLSFILLFSQSICLYMLSLTGAFPIDEVRPKVVNPDQRSLSVSFVATPLLASKDFIRHSAFAFLSVGLMFDLMILGS